MWIQRGYLTQTPNFSYLMLFKVPDDVRQGLKVHTGNNMLLIPSSPSPYPSALHPRVIFTLSILLSFTIFVEVFNYSHLSLFLPVSCIVPVLFSKFPPSSPLQVSLKYLFVFIRLVILTRLPYHLKFRFATCT